jgi:lipooligosaccharide transport system permease protein
MIQLRGVVAVCRRNAMVVRRMLGPFILGHVGEPLFYFVLFGYGLGRFVPPMDGRPYIEWLIPGLAILSSATSATLEGTYTAFTRMDRQKTYLAIASTPVSIEEVILGEAVWAALMGAANATLLVVVAAIFGITFVPTEAGAIIFVAFLAGLIASSLALLYTSTARGYEAFAAYFTLILTPSIILSGAYFPLDVLPPVLQLFACALPLTQPVLAVRASGGAFVIQALVTAGYALPLLALAVRRISHRVIV